MHSRVMNWEGHGFRVSLIFKPEIVSYAGLQASHLFSASHFSCQMKYINLLKSQKSSRTLPTMQ